MFTSLISTLREDSSGVSATFFVSTFWSEKLPLLLITRGDSICGLYGKGTSVLALYGKGTAG